MGIEYQRIFVGYDLNSTVLTSLRLDLPRDRLEIVHDHPRSLAAVERQLLLLQGAIEIHVEPSLYLLFYGRSTSLTSIQYDVVRANFEPDVVLLQYFVNIRFPNIGCHTIRDRNSRSTVCSLAVLCEMRKSPLVRPLSATDCPR